MIEPILKAIGIVGVVVICGALAFVLAYWTMKTCWDTPLFNLGSWTVIALIAVLLGWPKKKGQSSPD
jgi:hypothetical protein